MELKLIFEWLLSLSQESSWFWCRELTPGMSPCMLSYTGPRWVKLCRKTLLSCWQMTQHCLLQRPWCWGQGQLKLTVCQDHQCPGPLKPEFLKSFDLQNPLESFKHSDFRSTLTDWMGPFGMSPEMKSLRKKKKISAGGFEDCLELRIALSSIASWWSVDT